MFVQKKNKKTTNRGGTLWVNIHPLSPTLSPPPLNSVTQPFIKGGLTE